MRTGTHPTITERETMLTAHASTLVNSAVQVLGSECSRPALPTMNCYRAVATLKLPEFFESEDLGVSPARSCKRCRDCKVLHRMFKEGVIGRSSPSNVLLFFLCINQSFNEEM